jgi:methyl-accepting chemotaxis protein
MNKIGFKHSLITVIAALLLIALGTTSYVALDQLKETSTNALQKTIRNSISYEVENIKGYVDQRANPVIDVVKLFEENTYASDQEKANILATAAAVSGASKFTLGYEDGSSYVSRASGTFPGGVGKKDKYDPRTRPWYQLGRTVSELALTDVFFTKDKHEPMVGAVSPIKGDGVLLADVRLDQLQEMLSHVNVTDGAMTFLVDSQGLVLASTADYVAMGENINEIEATQSFAKTILGQAQIFDETVINGIKSTIASERFDVTSNTQWYFVMSVDSSIAYAAQQKASWKLLVVVSIITVVFIVLLVIVLNRLYRPVLTLRNLVTRLSNGDGDLTQRLQVTTNDDLGAIAHGINQFIESLQSMMLEVLSVTNRLTDGVKVLQTHSDESASVLEQHQRETEQVATAMAELSSTAELVVHNSEEAARFTQEANLTGETSKSTILKAQHSLSILAKEVEKSTLDVQKMSKETQDIATILNVIGGIAEQTNLLALNAAIEAARAGDQGRGFAVVADEVRALAQRTQKSTGEIDSALIKLQQGSESVVSSIESTKLTSEETIKEAAGVASSLETMTGFVTQINDLSMIISTSAQEQNAVIQEITQNMDRIHTMVESLNAKGSTVLEEATNIAQTNHQLANIVGKFKLTN